MSLGDVIGLGEEYFQELLAKSYLGIRTKINIPAGECLVIPSFYIIHAYGELIAYGEVIADGDLLVI